MAIGGVPGAWQAELFIAASAILTAGNRFYEALQHHKERSLRASRRSKAYGRPQ